MSAAYRLIACAHCRARFDAEEAGRCRRCRDEVCLPCWDRHAATGACARPAPTTGDLFGGAL